MAARSRSVGRYDLVVEIGKSQLGPLWVATAAGLEPRWVRCIALGPSAATRDVEALADIGRWSDGFRAEQAPSTLEVVSQGSDLALALGYVPSETLRSLLKLTHLKRERISTRIALALTLDVCKALAAAEARAAETGREPKFLWGGLLPDSILVGTDGTTRVLDLGVAAAWRQLSSEAEHPEVFAYSAPEQLEPGQLTPSSDVFVLGILLWEMLSGGKRLFAGSSQRAVVERLQKHRGGSAATSSLADALDAETQALLDRMLDPDPKARLRDVRELERALRAMGDAVAPPREVADFVTSFAQHPLDSRERALKRALQHGSGELGRRPISEPPPGPTATPPVAGRSEMPGVAAAKPLPLPAQAKLGARPAVMESRVPPPPPRVLISEPLPTVETRANDDDAASVRAEDILAALAVEDLEPTEIVPREVVADAVALGAAKGPADTLDAPEPSSPISSARRAPLTAVVVPSVVAGPDAPTLTPVPSILQTLRGPGLFEGPEAERALDVADPTSLEPVAPPEARKTVQVATAQPTSVAHAAFDFMRGARQRLPVSLVAALGGTALLLLIALVSVGGNSAGSAPEQTSKGLAEQLLVEPNAELERPSATDQRAQTPETPAPPAEARKAPEAENANATLEAGADVDQTKAATSESQPEPALAAARVVAPRAVTPRPVRRSSAARATTSGTKKKKLRATRTYIPSGI